MRFRFVDETDSAEAAARAEVLAAIDAWWLAFATNTQVLDAHFKRRTDWDLGAWMSERLGAVDPRLMWEYGPALRGEGHRLVITPESARAIHPLVDVMLARAPVLPCWEFYDARPPESDHWMTSNMKARLALADVPEIRIAISPGEHNTIDLTFYIGPTDADPDSVAFLTAETLLGEHIVDTWVGTLRPMELADAHQTVTVVPADLLGGVREAIDARIASLPAEPCRVLQTTAEWSLLSVEPELRSDYGGQSDVITFVTMRPDLWTATRASATFASRRFSRNGETFAYLKIDGRDGLEGSAFGDRGDIEDAVAGALGTEQLGAVIGGGTGLAYSYVLLALEDVDRATAAVRAALVAGKIPERSWLLFHDATLADEWVGMYPTTPPPPSDVELPHTA